MYIATQQAYSMSIQAVKLNWPKVVQICREAVFEATSFVVEPCLIDKDSTFKDLFDNELERTIDFVDHFEITMFQTDQFHPFHNDSRLDRALTKLIAAPNTDSVIEAAYDEMWDYLCEMGDIVEDYYTDSYNFPNGYTPPQKVESERWMDGFVEKTVDRILAEATTRPEEASL